MTDRLTDGSGIKLQYLTDILIFVLFCISVKMDNGSNKFNELRHAAFQSDSRKYVISGRRPEILFSTGSAATDVRIGELFGRPSMFILGRKQQQKTSRGKYAACPSLSLSHKHTHTHTYTHRHAHTHTLSLSLALSLSPSLSPPLGLNCFCQSMKFS